MPSNKKKKQNEAKKKQQAQKKNGGSGTVDNIAEAVKAIEISETPVKVTADEEKAELVAESIIDNKATDETEENKPQMEVDVDDKPTVATGSTHPGIRIPSLSVTPAEVQTSEVIVKSMATGQILAKPETFEIASDSFQKSTMLKDGNDLSLTKFRPGHNIWQTNLGPRNRNIEMFSQRISTHMSSFSLAQDHLDLLGMADFIGDVECFKKLFRSNTNSDAMSFLVHFVGNSMLVDDFDLMTLLWDTKETLGYNDSNGLIDLVRRWIPEDERKQASFGWRTSEILNNKNAMHHLFYACLNGQELKLKDSETAMEKVKQAGKNKLVDPASTTLPGSDTKFLSTNMWVFGKRTFLIGSNIPTFTYESEMDEDEPFINCLTTLGIHSPAITGENLTKWNGIDMWFNNMSLGASQTYLCHQDECKLLKTEFIKTDDIPKRANFNLQLLYSCFHNLLDGIEDCVRGGPHGHSYWLYRAPGKDFIGIYDVTPLLADQNNTGGKPLRPSTISQSQSNSELLLKRAELERVMTIGVQSGQTAESLGCSSSKKPKTLSYADGQKTLVKGMTPLFSSNRNSGNKQNGRVLTAKNQLENSYNASQSAPGSSKVHVPVELFKKIHILTGRVLGKDDILPEVPASRSQNYSERMGT